MENKNILRTTYIFSGLFLILIVFFSVYITIISPGQLNNSYNTLQDKLSESIIRGDILDRNGNVLATTKIDDSGNEYRYYPFNELFCHGVGSLSYGKYGLEGIYNYQLLTSDISTIDKFLNDLNGEKDQGNSLTSTFDLEIQQAAMNALSDYNGAVVVMEADTGKVLAMVSNPSYDPNTAGENWQSISEDTESPILNRVTQGLYTPGSIFKIFTMSEYLKQVNDLDYSYNCTGSIYIGDESISCSNKTAHGNVDLGDSFAYSCNCSFVNIGKLIDGDLFKESASTYLFNCDLPLDFPYSKGYLNISDSLSEFMYAQTVFGQGETLVTPIQMAMIVSAIANDGVLMKPLFAENIKNEYGTIIDEFEPEEYATIFSSEVNNKLQEYMSDVVEYGTAIRLNDFENLTIRGKTGTAQIQNGEKANSWFAGYGENEEHKYTVIVVCENVDNNISPAIPITKEIFKALD